MDLSELLYKAGHHNRLAQAQVYDHFAKKMFLLCRQYTKDDMIAGEVVIEGFLRFFRRLANFNYESEAATHQFLKKIMLHECIRQLKKTTKLFVVSTDTLPDTPLPEEVISQISAKEIYALIAKLPLGYRTVFNLVVMEGKTHQEIAAALKISKKTSQSQYCRAKYLLRQMLTQNNDDYESRKPKYNKEETE